MGEGDNDNDLFEDYVNVDEQEQLCTRDEDTSNPKFLVRIVFPICGEALRSNYSVLCRE